MIRFLLGHYMYAGDSQSVLIAPLYDHPTNHCLRFRYHMRMRDGATAGLLMFAQETDNGDATIPPRAITVHNASYLNTRSSVTV